MLVVPAPVPYTTPVEGTTVAILLLALLHVPPAGVQPNAVENPLHTERVPVIAPGSTLMVITVVMLQPVGNV